MWIRLSSFKRNCISEIVSSVQCSILFSCVMCNTLLKLFLFLSAALKISFALCTLPYYRRSHLIYRVGQKNDATLHFCDYPAIHFTEYLANYKRCAYSFLHTSRPVYSERFSDQSVAILHY